MFRSQTLAIRLSEIRQRLNEVAGLEGDALTDEIRAEADKLTGEYRDKETQHRAALVAESDEERAAEGIFGNGDGEPAEVRALLGRVRLPDYLGAAAAGLGLSGAPAAVTAFFSTATLRPKRLTGRFEFTNEVNAQVLDLEEALWRDLADAVKSAMSDAILNDAAVDPQDGGDGGDDDPTKMLKSDLAVGKGRTMVVETTSARWGDG